MNEILKFYKWYTNRVGGVISEFVEVQNFDFLNYIDLKVSSFKHRASEIKETYNYKFVK